MKKTFSLSIILFTTVSVFAQFKNDNVLYKTIFPEKLCPELQKTNDYLLLDVRSKGEFDDTSSAAVYNLGHLKDARNINVRELGNRISEIKDYKNKPVYVYCSHSQRSRRASKMLSDSGFTNIINVNGGVTAFRQLPEENCLSNYLVTNVSYHVISVNAMCKKIAAGKKTFILDVRSDSAFKRIDKNAKINSFGHFKGSVNIPVDDITKRLAEIPMDKDIVVVDLFGDDAAKVASILTENKYKNVSVLLEGIDRLYYTDSREMACIKNSYSSPVKYDIMSTIDFKRFAESNSDYLTLDVRSVEEFTNKHKDNWRNIGHLVNAVNIPVGDLSSKTNINRLEKFSKKPVIIYAFSGSTEAHEAAIILSNYGFTNIHVLAGGIFNVRWTANNVYNSAALSKMVEDVPAENL